MSNILSLPMAALVVETGTNEDWIDSLLFLVDNGSGNINTMLQLDLRGITFEMEIRRQIDDHAVVIHASTENGMLQIGDYPNYGYLIINVDVSVVSVLPQDSYVGDIVASDSAFVRRVMTLDLNIVEGVTR
jgi:hypothetical protein